MPDMVMMREDFGDTSTAHALEFIAWMLNKYPNVDLLASVPAAELRRLTGEFSTEKGYSDVATFTDAVLNWPRGSGQQEVLTQLAANSAQLKQANATYREDVSPFKRYLTVPFHAMFLLDKAGLLGKFVATYWVELNTMTGDLLDIYYGKKDLGERATAYDLVKDLRSLKVRNALLPALLVWPAQLSDGILITLRKLSEDDIYQMMKQVVDTIDVGLAQTPPAERQQILTEVGNAAQSFVQQTLAAAPAQVVYNISSGGGAVVIGSSNRVENEVQT